MNQKQSAKIIFVLISMVSLGMVLGVAGYLFIAKPKPIQPVLAPQAISKTEISADKKSILNSETKEVIFTIDDAKKYLKDSGYEYNPDTFQDTDAKYLGDCFGNAALSNEKDRIVFSTGCLAGDLPQAWVGTYYAGINYSCPKCEIYYSDRFKFLIGGSGRNFAWSQDDKTITYEADPGLSGITETRTIDSQTGEILKKEIKPSADISDWLTYNSISDAESYSEEYKLKYPRELFSKSERAKGTYALSVFFKDKFGKILFSAETITEDNGGLAYNSRSYYIIDTKIGNNNFQELKDKKSGILTYLYKTGYKDANHNYDHYIVFELFDPASKETLITALGTLQFLGKNTGEAIVGADEGSWKKIFKSEEYGFQIKYQNGFRIIDNLADNLSLIFVDGGMYSNITLGVSRLSGVSTVDEWMDRELTINKNAPKKADREYYRIGNSDKFGVLVNQADASGNIRLRVFYAARGQYLYSISAPIAGTNEFAYYRTISNFSFPEPKYELLGIKSKWAIDSVFEFNSDTGKVERVLNEADFSEKGYKWSDVKWYTTKTAGTVPEEIKSFFPVVTIAPQGLLNTDDWQVYRGKDDDFEFAYPNDWELENYSSSDIAFFNVNKEKENAAFPRVTVMIDRTPSPSETLSMIGYMAILKFGGTESLLTSMYGKKGETDPYSYLSSGNSLYVEFHSGAHDYFIEYHFSGEDFNKNMQTLYTVLSSMKFYR